MIEEVLACLTKLSIKVDNMTCDPSDITCKIRRALQHLRGHLRNKFSEAVVEDYFSIWSETGLLNTQKFVLVGCVSDKENVLTWHSYVISKFPPLLRIHDSQTDFCPVKSINQQNAFHIIHAVSVKSSDASMEECIYELYADVESNNCERDYIQVAVVDRKTHVHFCSCVIIEWVMVDSIQKRHNFFFYSCTHCSAVYVLFFP